MVKVGLKLALCKFDAIPVDSRLNLELRGRCAREILVNSTNQSFGILGRLTENQ